MKDFSQKLLPMAFVGTLIMGACGTPTNFTKNNYSVNPDPLEMKGDSVIISITGNVPPKSIGAKALVTFTPYLKTADGKEITLKSTTIKGIKAKGTADQTVDTKLGGKITYTDKIPYTADMRRSKLMPRFALDGKPVPVLETALAQGTIATAGMVQFSNEAFAITDNYKPEMTNKAVEIYFPMDQSRFNPNFKLGKSLNNKTQIAALKKLLKKDPTWIVKGISINSTASPDGELARNNNLSKGRSESTFAYFRKELKKLGFTEVNDSNFTMGYMLAEDWKSFAAAVAASNLTDKAEMLSIINNTGISDEEKEGLLRRNHVKSWKFAADKILPNLRKSELVLIGSKPFKNDADLMTYHGKYEVLSNDELFHLALISTDNAQKTAAFSAYNTRNANEWKGLCALAVMQIGLGQLDEASANLTAADAISPNNGKVLSNQAVIALKKGNLTAAETLYAKALAAGENTNYNLGLFEIKKGNYNAAMSSFVKSGKTDFNTALAQLLSGDAQMAKASIDNMNPDQLTWECFYLRAICGARLADQDGVTTNLARAVAMNAQARNLAKDDMEFAKFFNNPLFEAAIR
jgi:hypothetical protein